ncbi:MAG: Ni/Fe-hydrogenase, b-type cytochrome subunit, partial [Caldimicrobium sp.]|nr:Ni/Fe-hydrogenase, b-type cytochrome subunit [Caldimicrobium sp.]MCX7612604.1 Ni/Fe-hydrogenase, b-type cytochrome subunit [Caldimicrobium sp.]MDW8182992.1 Ni/Fe-hydrogenase, b-type cytochrome subunit [Caldimicrobium sp.]
MNDNTIDNYATLLRRVAVWSAHLRLFHWIFALSTALLILTGLYINNPPTTLTWSEHSPSYVMTYVRYVHFIAGFFFIAVLLIRIYLLFFGNEYERIKALLPLSKERVKSMFEEAKFDLYLSDKPKTSPGHTNFAGILYMVIFILAILMAISGLGMLYPESTIFRVLTKILFGSPQMARFIHYTFLWIFLSFICIHIYMAIWYDLRGSLSITTAMITGYKT